MEADARSAPAALATQHRELAGILAELDEEGWHRPTRCEGWDVADVVIHLAQTDEMAVGSLTGRFDEVAAEQYAGLEPPTSVDDGVDRMVARDRTQPLPAIHERWQRATRELAAAIDATDPRTRVRWVAGELTARTLVTTRLAETWIHTGDVAGALGREQEVDDRLWHITRLAWRTIPYAFSREGRVPPGPVALHLLGPGGEPWDFLPDAEPSIIVRGHAVELCDVAARRRPASATSLRAEGPRADEVLDLIRTYA
jgi:uncharacterized protein (TIGR03084 family)